MSRPARAEVLAFLSDVKDNPDDPTPWLVLTDWLEENGDEADRARAEYCRLCFDKLGKKTVAGDWDEGERRRELFRRYKKKWFGPLIELPPVYGKPRIEVRRGLLHVNIEFAVLLSHVGEGPPDESWAWVQELQLTVQSSEEIEHLASWPFLLGPRHLQVQHTGNGQPPTPQAIQALADSPYLDHLRSLRFWSSAVHGVWTEEGYQLNVDFHALYAPLKQRLGRVFWAQ
jgi:uncharacterized protein (TIGR02996 family)